MNENAPNDVITPAGNRLIIGWTIALILLALFTGYWFSRQVHENKQHAIENHANRIHPTRSEAGKTQAATTPPPGFEDAVPMDVLTGIYIDRIVNLSMPDHEWTVDFYLWFRWTGDESINPGERFQIVDGIIDSKEKLTEEAVDGEYYQLYRVQGTISKFFNIGRFPNDDHLLTIHIEDTQDQSYRLRYIADTVDSDISSRVKVQGYEIYDTSIVVKPHSYKTRRGDLLLPADYHATYSQFIYGIWIQRPDWSMYFKLFLALYLAVGIALLSFMVSITYQDSRFGLGVGALFAAVANTYVVSTLVPNTGEMSLADIINIIGIATILLILLESVIALYLAEGRGLFALSKRFDRVSLTVITIGYTIINIVIPYYAKL